MSRSWNLEQESTWGHVTKSTVRCQKPMERFAKFSEGLLKACKQNIGTAETLRVGDRAEIH